MNGKNIVNVCGIKTNAGLFLRLQLSNEDLSETAN